MKRFFKKVVLSLGSLHLTLMSAIGIWLWASPSLFEQSQQGFTMQPPDSLPIECTSTALLGHSIKLTSSGLQRWSLVIYSVFLVPGLNLLLPVFLFLALHIGFHKLPIPEERSKTIMRRLFGVAPVLVGLIFLLAINIVFLVDIETTIHRARGRQESGESEWTFGQTLALLLLSLPIRDVFEFALQVQELKHRDMCTRQLRTAIEEGNLAKVKEFAQEADVRVEAEGAQSKSLLSL
jgi:hypothetical protein